MTILHTHKFVSLKVSCSFMLAQRWVSRVGLAVEQGSRQLPAEARLDPALQSSRCSQCRPGKFRRELCQPAVEAVPPSGRLYLHHELIRAASQKQNLVLELGDGREKPAAACPLLPGAEL